ncbi:hypothetical protein THIARS_40208 [Thiomonas delicata]|uniref:Uncharacterized protein n=1 Tax=Thiomonas delicata TaxID=364030 RepID=A0A238D019_THIDL|nr:hypothetical protein THIARS_40208 [Thiomonas delicata]
MQDAVEVKEQRCVSVWVLIHRHN